VASLAQRTLAVNQVSVLFVCLGNICRSPTAEAVFRSMVREAGLADRVVIDSAGTSSWEVGNPPDERSVRVASRRNYSFDGQTARQLTRADLEEFDLIVAMDRSNLKGIAQLDGEADARLLLDFAPDLKGEEVPDPWYHGRFEAVLDMIEQGAAGLLDEVRKRLA